MDHIQIFLDSNPDNEAVRGDLANVMNEYYSLCVDEEKFLKQRSKVKWLSEGDKNTTFFHNTLKSNMNRHRIEAVLDEGGSWVRGKDTTDRFVGHFRDFLGLENIVQINPNFGSLFENKLDENMAIDMIRVISDK